MWHFVKPCKSDFKTLSKSKRCKEAAESEAGKQAVDMNPGVFKGDELQHSLDANTHKYTHLL